MGCGKSKYEKPKELKSVWHPKYFEGLPRMEGKVVAITGCTSGTGFVCARDCARLGATVLMLNRNSERATAALEAVKVAAPGAKVIHIPCDLMSFAAVPEAAAKIREAVGETGLDVLCNNAGVMASKDEATKDGYDVQMQTNHLSHFLLTRELWPQLTKAAELRGEARVVNHSSVARKGKKLEQKYMGKNGGNLGGDKEVGTMPCSGARWERYHQTKLANLVFTLALRDRVVTAGSKVKVMVAHPGVAATELQVHSVSDGGMSGGVANLIVSQTAEDGALGILMSCCDPAVQSGGLYGPGGQGLKGMAKLLPAAPEEKLADEASRTLLWEASEEATGGKFAI